MTRALAASYDAAPESGTADTLVEGTIRAVERRALWLATAMIDHANRVRPNSGQVKIGGHQASSASLATVMSVLWLKYLQADDRVSVKPHASPMLHALEFLLGQLDAHHLQTLREFNGIQSYPSRSKDPVPADYSTGSVGIGATAPIWGTLARRYVNDHGGDAGKGRQYSIVGDAELDEGACWEAVLDPMTADLGEVVWIVDYNRQSLDRVAPKSAAGRFEGMFGAAGWQVMTVKYGKALERLFAGVGGPELRHRIDSMSNGEYQRLLRQGAAEIRTSLAQDAPVESPVHALLQGQTDESIEEAIRCLGGHDVEALSKAFEQIDDSRPTVIFVYTIKGFGLPTQGHPQNHSALLSKGQVDELAAEMSVDPRNPWVGFAAGSAEHDACSAAAVRLARESVPTVERVDVPSDLGRVRKGVSSTQTALGRTLLDLARAAPEAAGRIVTISPDVSSSTNLGGWVNKVGVWSTTEHPDWFADDAATLLHWKERPAGQHVELGIAEVNLVSALAEFGSTWSRWGSQLLPIGVLYDPFVERALEPWSFGIYAGGQSILVGTPSGVTLGPEGGAHQSIKTPSIGIEQPGCTSYEPAFMIDTEWCLLAALADVGHPDGQSYYLRLSTKAVDQTLAAVPTDPAARERRRRQVVAGGYVLRSASEPRASVIAVGAMVPEALAAAERLAGMDVATDVICLTSPDRIFRAMQSRRGLDDAPSWILDDLFPIHRAGPMVTVVDGHPHTLAFLGGLHGGRSAHLGVRRFGQSGDVPAMYNYHGIGVDDIVRSALDLLP